MADSENEKTLGAAVNIELIEAFDRINMEVFGSGFRKKQLWNAFVRWWIDLPKKEKEAIYAIGNSAEIRPLKQWILEIVDGRVSEIIKSSHPAADKPIDRQAIEACQNLRQYVRYHIASGDAAKELESLRKALGPVGHKKKKTRQA